MTYQPQFTPGKWHWEVNYSSPATHKGAFVKTENNIPLASVHAQSINSQDECEANAGLMAAAPELYRIMETTLNTIEANGEWEDARCFYYNRRSAPELESPIRMMRAILQKIRGNEPCF